MFLRGIKRTGVVTVRFSLTTVRATEGCNNVQMAVDSQHTRIVANDVTHDPGDRDGAARWRCRPKPFSSVRAMP